MCRGCYEDYGEPTIVTEATKRAAELCAQLYELEPCGGLLHIVTDDWNLEDHHVEWCRAAVEAGGYQYDKVFHRENPEALAIEKELLALLIPMTEEERASALGLWDGFVSTQPQEAGK